jgi:non-ribosomal peptide synthetase component E (peptide arylation enzyme)
VAALLTAGALIATHARIRPEKIGARDSTRALTFREWNQRACRLANALLETGLT